MLKYLFFWLIFRVLGLLPLRVLYLIADFAGTLGYALFPSVRANVLDNLSHVMPNAVAGRQRRRAARRIFRNVGRYYADLAHLPKMDAQQFFDRRLRVFGLREHLLPAVESGRGVIMLSGHFGNPELAVQGLIPCGVRVFAVTEPLQPAALSAMLDGIRASKGHAFAPVSVGSAKRVIKTLKSGGVVALMGDRDIQGPKQRLPFFGAETWMPTGPMEVALRTGAVVIPSFSMRRGSKLEAHMHPPLEFDHTGDFQQDVRAGTLAYVRLLEGYLSKEPEQWAVLEKLWDAAGEEAGAKREVRKAMSADTARLQGDDD
ncbi:MAG: lysophospholipid acyltransferase family protein [Chloroflexi bacterium]|nr:MAG: lysophospholipid acyltransferase family protein [Chloroflexota bacterium]